MCIRDRPGNRLAPGGADEAGIDVFGVDLGRCRQRIGDLGTCLLYTSDAADDLLCVDLGGRRIIKKKKIRTYQVP